MPDEQPASLTPNPPDEADEPPNHGLLWDEYKLLQEKLDRIGDFRFRVKAWVVSLAGILVVGGAALRGPWWATFFAIPPVLLFALLEHYYGYVENALATRLRALEPELQRREFRHLTGTAKRHGRRRVGPRLTESIDSALKNHGVVRHAHSIFYLVMVVLLAGLTVVTKRYRLEEQPKQVIVNCPATVGAAGDLPGSATTQLPSPPATGVELLRQQRAPTSAVSLPNLANSGGAARHE